MRKREKECERERERVRESERGRESERERVRDRYIDRVCVREREEGKCRRKKPAFCLELLLQFCRESPRSIFRTKDGLSACLSVCACACAETHVNSEEETNPHKTQSPLPSRRKLNVIRKKRQFLFTGEKKTN